MIECPSIVVAEEPTASICGWQLQKQEEVGRGNMRWGCPEPMRDKNCKNRLFRVSTNENNVASGRWLVASDIQWGMLQQTVFINTINMLRQTQMLQQTQRNTIGQRITQVRMMCWAFLLWLECQSSSSLWPVRFSYQFSSVICLFAPLAGKDCLCFSCALDCLCFLLGKVCSEIAPRKNCFCFLNLHVHYTKLKKN